MRAVFVKVETWACWDMGVFLCRSGQRSEGYRKHPVGNIRRIVSFVKKSLSLCLPGGRGRVTKSLRSNFLGFFYIFFPKLGSIYNI